MKLAVIGSRGFPSTYGGYETLVRHLAPALVRDGHDVTVYCRDRVTGSARERYVDGVRCIHTPGHESTSLSTLSYGFTACADAALRGYDAALVLNMANGYWLPMLRAAGIPTALNTDGIEWERLKWGRLARAVFRGGASVSATLADTLIADSQAIARVWRARFGVESVYIPYGAPMLSDVPTTGVRAMGLAPGRYVLVVARLIPENNVDLTLDAVEGMPGVPTVVVGSAVEGCPIHQRLERMDAEGRIRWLGHVSDQSLLDQLWAHCGVYVHGHSVGGTNPSLLQAMGAGAPTLALRTAYNDEVLRNDDQLFDADPAGLAERIAAVLESPALREDWSRHQRTVVARDYRWTDVIERYAQVLEALAESRPATVDRRSYEHRSRPLSPASAMRMHGYPRTSKRFGRGAAEARRGLVDVRRDVRSDPAG